MADYNFYDPNAANAVTNYPSGKLPEATPGDMSNITIRRGRIDTSKQTINAGEKARWAPVYAGEVVIGVVGVIDTAETTANCDVDCGIDGGTEFGGANAYTLDSAANTVFVDFGNATYVASDGNLTLEPNNSVAMDTAVVNMMAFIVKDIDLDW
jgi:hypothetical protein